MSQEQAETITTAGRVLHGACGYDLLVWVLTRGRSARLHRRLLDLARVTAGERLLDIGCGTGSLAIEAKRRIGPAGGVAGIDPSPQMVARANRKARRAAIAAEFHQAVAERLPFGDGQFDVVTSTLMLHHLPRLGRAASFAEVARVLRPGGRVLAVDFGAVGRTTPTLLSRLHRRHGHVKLDDVIALAHQTGLDIVDSGQVGMNNLNYILAVKPVEAAL